MKNKITLTNSWRKRVFGFLFAGLIVSVIASAVTVGANNIRWYISSSDPYRQDWSDTISISTDNDWSNFIAINGYRGDGMTAAEGVNPQTVLADGESTPLSVIANQSNPNTLNVGGVAEFDGIANPTVALRGSAVARAPHLVIQVNKESCPDSKFISLTYRVRDLDSTANNAVQPVALQFRYGTTGNYTNVPSAYLADATEPNSATKTTSVVANLPHGPVGQDIVYIRILTTDAVGNDEWIGIDDIGVGCYVSTAAEVDVSGRAMRLDGRGISNGVVTLIDAFGSSFTTRTNSFGYYRFSGIPAGGTYTIQASAKGMRFDPQIVTLVDNVTDLDFYATGTSTGGLAVKPAASDERKGVR